MDKIQEFHKLISDSKNILITSHVKSDADSVASVLGMFAYLTKKYPSINAKIYLEGEAGGWSFLSYIDQINWVKDLKPHLHDFDTLIFLDGNTRGRFTEKEAETIDLAKFRTICIDHHPNEPDPFDVDLSDLTAPATADIIYQLFFRTEKDLLDSDIAKILMMGIMGDTGTFRYVSPKNSAVLIHAKELIDIGGFEVQNLDLHLSQFDEESMEVLKVLMANTVNVELEGIAPFTYSYLPMKALETHSINAIKGATGIFKFNVLRQIKNHNWGFVVTPDSPDQIGISFRSTPGFPNVKLLANMFDGGGHVMAAGGRYVIKPGEKFDSIDLVQKILETIKSAELEITSAN